MENPGFIGTADIQERYLPLGFQFQAGRARAGAGWCWSFCSFQIHVREAIYLDNMLDPAFTGVCGISA